MVSVNYPLVESKIPKEVGFHLVSGLPVRDYVNLLGMKDPL